MSGLDGLGWTTKITPEERARIIVESLITWPAIDLEALRNSISEAIYDAVRSEVNIMEKE